MALVFAKGSLAAVSISLLPATLGLSLDGGARGQPLQQTEHGKIWITDHVTIDHALQRSDLYQHFNARNKYLQCPPLNASGPHIIHLMYFPWNKTTQTLKANEEDFDKDFWERLVERVDGKWCVKLWKYSEMRHYVQKEYPGLWELVNKYADRPVALVDFFRLLVVYEFGGIFWQYGSEPTAQMWKLPDPFQPFMPPVGKSSRLLIEKWMTQEQADEVGRTRKSRMGRPSSLMRIATQVFAAQPHDSFLRFAMKRAIWNLMHIPVERDFDILETMGNGMFSEAFADFQKLGKAGSIDVVSFDEVGHMVRYSHTFSWRRDKGRCC